MADKNQQNFEKLSADFYCASFDRNYKFDKLKNDYIFMNYTFDDL